MNSSWINVPESKRNLRLPLPVLTSAEQLLFAFSLGFWCDYLDVILQSILLIFLNQNMEVGHKVRSLHLLGFI